MAMARGWGAAALAALAALPVLAQGGGAYRGRAFPTVSRLAKRTDGGGDGRATVDASLMAVLRDAHAKGFGNAAIAGIIEAIDRDGVVDPAEFDLLDELCMQKPRSIAVVSKEDPNTPLLLPTVFGDSARRFEAVLDRPVKGWIDAKVPEEGWAKLLGAAEYSDTSELRVRAHLTEALRAAWAKSDVSNAYKVFSDLLTVWFKANGTLPEPKHPLGRWLLFAAAKDLDGQSGDKIPDFLYTWIRPMP